ncbi:MAG TPA: TonB-dependent receptor [Gemmatimonadaceae bacterium]|nr:TonB-dependent receptor [Gemmatimonadaceae bacterium]
MKISRCISAAWRTTRTLLLTALGPAAALAQSGRISGMVTDSAKAPMAGAQVAVVGTRHGALTDAGGRFTIGAVDAGTYEVRVQRIGEQAKSVTGVVVRAGEETRVDVTLVRAPLSLAGVVVSASRRAEKVTDAPATITSIGTDVIDNTVGNNFAGLLKEVKGLDFIQVGMTAVAINARGFNSSFNNRMLMTEDGRVSVLPENGLPVGTFTATPKVDLAGIEVLVGPGSALYGPDASNGVLALTTKDPRDFKGTTLEITGGNRSYRDIQGRYANTFGNFGFKVSGEYQAAKDWDNFLNYSPTGSIVPAGTAGAVNEKNLKDPVDWDTGVIRGSGGLVYYKGAQRLELSGGMSQTDAVGQTNVGRNQLRDWDYNTLQLRYSLPHWYFNTYRSQSQSGSSFALNRYAGAQLAPANAALSADSLRKLSDWPSDGRMYAAEVQGNYELSLLRNTSVVFGAQYRNDVVSSDRQWLWDRITKEDVSNAQTGIYAQTTTPVARWLDIVLAGRLDDPENYDKQWSPKAGVVVKPWLNQAFRVTFNRAFKSPTILQTNFFIPDWTAIISIYGNTGGFQMTNADGTVRSTYQPMKPESNKTWEFGYKGIIADRLYLDGTYFKSDYENFMSPLTIIGNPFATAAAGGPTFAKPLVNPGNSIPVNAQGRIVNQAATPITPIVLTYYNLGNAKVSGVDAGLTALLTRHLEARTTLSTVKIDKVTVPTGASPEATSLNAPSTKWTVGATARDLGPLSVGLTFRNVNQYYFRSGTNTGVIPTFGTLDANVSIKVPSLQNSLVSLSVSNLFSCTHEDIVYATPTGGQPFSRITSSDKGCGLDRKHIEMVNMPQIGTMMFLGIRFNR